MSGVPSSSQRPHSVVRESTSSAQKVSSGTSYKHSQHTETSRKNSVGAIARRATIAISSQHTDPNEGSTTRADQGATSKEPNSHNSDKGDARRSLKYTSTTSWTEDSQRIISELRREIHDLKQEERGRSLTKERPRNRVNASKRKNPRHDSHGEDFSETFCSQSEPRPLTPQPVPKQPLESRGHSRSRPPLHIGRSP